MNKNSYLTSGLISKEYGSMLQIKSQRAETPYGYSVSKYFLTDITPNGRDNSLDVIYVAHGTTLLGLFIEIKINLKDRQSIAD